MQKDMHYYGIYALARAAGVNIKTATDIATASQFVDDSDTVSEILSDGGFLYHRATAHHPLDVPPNTDPADQRCVWLPFHFIPGNEGNSIEERLVCSKDSSIAKDIVEHALSLSKETYGPILLGIALHVYADSFSHYGFSGISSKLNHVKPGSIDLKIENKTIFDYVKNKIELFFGRLATGATNLIGLGHGGVESCPDRPYLVWSFIYEHSNILEQRDNPTTYLEACEKIFNIFKKLISNNPSLSDGHTENSFGSIRATVQKILITEAAQDDRIKEWESSFKAGHMNTQPSAETIPAYNERYFAQHYTELRTKNTQDEENTPAFQFLKAAKSHRDYVLESLLPKYGLTPSIP